MCYLKMIQISIFSGRLHKKARISQIQMLKKARGFDPTDLLAVMVIIVILAALTTPNIIIGIQKSKQKNTMKDTTIISMGVIEKIKTGNRTFNEYIQGIMGVNRSEKELAKSIEILDEHLTKTWRIKPWERNVSNLNNSGRKNNAGI